MDELDKLQRELANRQQLIEEKAANLLTVVTKENPLPGGEQHSELLSAEWGRLQENVALQAKKWKEYSESISEGAEEAVLSARAERHEAEEEIDHHSSALIDAHAELEERDAQDSTSLARQMNERIQQTTIALHTRSREQADSHPSTTTSGQKLSGRSIHLTHLETTSAHGSD